MVMTATHRNGCAALETLKNAANAGREVQETGVRCRPWTAAYG